MRNFKQFEIWQLGFELTLACYQLTKHLPDEEKFGLTSQMRRSSVSIPANIAEGCGRKSDKDFSRFLEIALGSSFEFETHFMIADQLGYLSSIDPQPMYELVNKVQRKTNALITTLSS